MSARNADPHLDEVLREVVAELVAQGAVAIALGGSRGRGDHYAESDVDVEIIGEGPEYSLARRNGFLFALCWIGQEALFARFQDPANVGGFVPFWRGARILHDPNGVATKIRDTALAWTWDSLDEASDAWVANEITGLAEEVHRLVGNFGKGRVFGTAFVRNVLALRMAGIMAVHRRILYDSENALWDCVADAMGTRWRDAQLRAFGVGGESFEETCRAALELYALSAAEVSPLLKPEQREVVEHACAIGVHFINERSVGAQGPAPLQPIAD